MRIVLVTTWGRKCGLSVYAEHLADEWKRAGHQVWVLDELQKIEANRRDVPPINYVACWTRPDPSVAILNEISYIEPDVCVFSHDWEGVDADVVRNLAEGCHDLNCRLFVSWHNLVDIPNPAQEVKEIDGHIVFHPEAAKFLASRGIQPERVKFVPHGCNNLPIPPRTSVRPRHKLSTFGLMYPSKGLDQVVEVLAMVRKRLPQKDVVLDIFSSYNAWTMGAYTHHIDEVNQLIADYELVDSVNLWGGFPTEEGLLRAISDSDAILLLYKDIRNRLSGSAALPFALSSSIPTVTSDISHFAGSVDRSAAHLMTSKLEDAAERIVELLTNEQLWQRYAINSYNYACSNTYKHVAESYIEFFLSLGTCCQTSVSFSLSFVDNSGNSCASDVQYSAHDTRGYTIASTASHDVKNTIHGSDYLLQLRTGDRLLSGWDLDLRMILKNHPDIVDIICSDSKERKCIRTLSNLSNSNVTKRTSWSTDRVENQFRDEKLDMLTSTPSVDAVTCHLDYVSKSPRPIRILLHFRDSAIELWVSELETIFKQFGWETRRFECFGTWDEDILFPNFQDVIASWQPDVLFAFASWEGGPSQRMLALCNQHGVLRAAWSIDEPYRFDGFDRLCQIISPHYDLWFTNWHETANIAWYRKVGADARYLPCSSLTAMNLKQNTEKIFDISFVGTYYEPRRTYLAALSHLDASYWLTGRKFPDNMAWPPPNDIAKCIAGGLLSPEQVASVINSTKINLDISEQPDGRVRCAKSRLFEILSCGGFALSGRCDQIDMHFVEGVHLECYDSTAELLEKSVYYLTHDDERNKIASRGHAAAISAHSLHHRAKVIVQAVEERLQRNAPLSAISQASSICIVIPVPSGLETHCLQAITNLVAFDNYTSIVAVSPDTVGYNYLSEYLSHFPNVRVIHHNVVESGLGDLCNRGVLESESLFVQFMHPTFELMKGWRTVVQALLTSGVDGVVSSCSGESSFYAGIPISALCLSKSTLYTIGMLPNYMNECHATWLIDRLRLAGYYLSFTSAALYFSKSRSSSNGVLKL